MNPVQTPAFRSRVCVALSIGLAAALLVIHRPHSWRSGDAWSDFDYLWAAARYVARGANPYPMIGPGREFDFAFPLVYPLSTVVGLLPLAALPMWLARSVFVAAGSSLLAFALTKEGWDRLAVFCSGCCVDAILACQWSPLITAAAMLQVGWLLTLKPSTGLALSVATGPRVAVYFAVTAGLLGATALILQPHWPAEWIACLRGTRHFRAPITRPLGLLVLLALIRWRRVEARWLVALACVPHSPAIYEALPLMLIPRKPWPTMFLIVCSVVQPLIQAALIQGMGPAQASRLATDLMIAMMYLPAVCLLMLPDETPNGTLLNGDYLTSQRPLRTVGSAIPPGSA